METVTPLLKPDTGQMVHHLGLLFGRAMSGKIELTAIKAGAKDERPHTRFFDVSQMDEAAEWAATINSDHMWNVYVGAAVRDPDTFPGKAATDEDFYRAWAIHADIDDVHDLPSVRERYRALGMTPPFIVVTGRTPTTRAQLWWPLDEAIKDPDVYRRTLRATAVALKTDLAVTAAKQLMRLAGTVNWPKKEGRVLEKTEIVQPEGAQAAFSIEQVQRAFPVDVTPPATAHDHEKPGSLAGAMAAPDLRSALASMRADDYDLWIRMGHALKELGDVGRGLWLEWSQTSDKYDPADARRWDTFQPQRTGYQAVFAEAQRQGWVNPAKAVERHDSPPVREIIDQTTGEVIEVADDGLQDVTSRPISAAEFTGEPPEREWIVDQWIVKGAVNSLYGDGGLGKTLLAQQLACAAAIGAKWLGMQVAQGPVLAVLCEDEKDELHRRHNAIKAALGHPMGNPFHDVWLWPRVGDENVLIRWDKNDAPVLGSFMARLIEEVETLNPSLLILDTLADFYAGNEISRPHVNYFVKTVLGGLIKRQKAKGESLTILLLGHPSVAGKSSGSGYSGSTAWNAAVRSRMYLSRPEEGASDERILTRGKANYAKSGDETAVRLFFADGTLHACEDAEDTDSVLWSCKEDICKAVDRAWRDGRPYSGQKTHARFIYTALPKELQGQGFAPQLVRQALRELIVDDAVVSLAKGRDKRGYRTSRSGD